VSNQKAFDFLYQLLAFRRSQVIVGIEQRSLS